MTTALLIVGHGSRAPGANEALYRVAQAIRERAAYAVVEVAFLELSEPGLVEAAGRCVARGATRVLFVPYFLHLGRHVIEHLPAEVEACRRRHPGVEFAVGEHLGFHPLLVQIVLDRVRESDPWLLREKAGLPAGRPDGSPPGS